MRRLILLLLLGLGTTMLMGCEQEGPMERAGKKVDRAVDDTGDAIDDATDR